MKWELLWRRKKSYLKNDFDKQTGIVLRVFTLHFPCNDTNSMSCLQAEYLFHPAGAFCYSSEKLFSNLTSLQPDWQLILLLFFLFKFPTQLQQLTWSCDSFLFLFCCNRFRWRFRTVEREKTDYKWLENKLQSFLIERYTDLLHTIFYNEKTFFDILMVSKSCSQLTNSFMQKKNVQDDKTNSTEIWRCFQMTQFSINILLFVWNEISFCCFKSKNQTEWVLFIWTS